MADIQSATAEIRRGKERRYIDKKKEETTRQKYNGLPYSIGGHKKRKVVYVVYTRRGVCEAVQ